jgi:hypothetical protein
MSTRVRSAQLLQRAALLLALICFWISGPVALHHTDEPLLPGLNKSTADHSLFGHVTPPPAQTPCAACEWEQSLSTPHAPSVHIAWLPFFRVAFVGGLPTALHLRSFEYISLRGPPANFS